MTAAINLSLNPSAVELFKEQQHIFFPCLCHSARITYLIEKNQITIEFYSDDLTSARSVCKLIEAGNNGIVREGIFAMTSILIRCGKYENFYGPNT